MREALSIRKTAALALGIFMSTLGATAVVRAQVGAGGTVLGCVASSGIIRGIDEATGTCRAGDVTLSWLTTAGATAAFLGRTAKAVDSDRLDGLDASAFLPAGAKASDSELLDGLDSTRFLTNGAGAGGALGGSYPSPSIAAGAIDTAAIQNGAVTAEKLAPDLEIGRGPLVRDYYNTVVGSLLSSSGDVLITVNGESFVLDLSGGYYSTVGYPALIFLHADCTGTPYRAFTNPPERLVPIAEFMFGAAWIHDSSVASVYMPAGAPAYVRNELVGSDSCQAGAYPSPVTLYPIRSVSVAGFQPPFRVE